VNRVRAGTLTAALLAGAWRATPPPLTLRPDEIDQAVDAVAPTRAAPLAWRRLRDVDPRPRRLDDLREAYRYCALQAAVRESTLRSAAGVLRDASVEPLVVKGWNVARLYPEGALRPYDDVDVAVSPASLERATHAVAPLQSGDAMVDLDHSEITELDDRDWNELFAHSQLVAGPGGEVRVPSDADQLRITAIHALKHGVWNPLWLCDVAVALESAGPAFDWNRCLGSIDPQRDWVLTAFALARALLGARVPSAIAGRVHEPPRWVVRSVLRTWSDHDAGRRTANVVPIARYGPRVWAWPRALRERWPTPVAATIELRASFHAGFPVVRQIGTLIAPRRVRGLLRAAART